MSKEDWRSSAAYEYADTLDPAALAWEFLRRNPDYHLAFGASSAHADDRTDGPARRWGLRFPRRSRSTR
ncbi:transcriptional regulator domain-containing protein [Blastochloris sulfoviridis]|uniref:transcriptional regulator domain-containing protein n=1 Tax=Blastochloris sulfoviridis TaxID=50712 RepID=UPI003CCC5A48